MDAFDGQDRRVGDASGAWRSDIASRVGQLETAVAENTNLTKQIAQNTEDIVAFFKAGEGAFKFLKAVGAIAKWVTAVTAAVGVIWFALKGGKP